MPAPPKQVITSTDDDTLPWERQPNETEEAYSAFVVYRNMGVKRSLRGMVPAVTAQMVAAKAQQAAQGTLARGKDRKTNQPTDDNNTRAHEPAPTAGQQVYQKPPLPDTVFRKVAAWSTSWEWRERCRLWDVQQQRIADRQAETKRDKLKVDHTNSARTLLSAALRLVQPPPELLAPGQEQALARWRPDHQNLRAASDAINNAIRNERLSADMPTEITRAEVLLKEQLREAVEVNTAFLRIIQEHLCDDCRDRAYNELERAARLHQQTAASVY